MKAVIAPRIGGGITNYSLLSVLRVPALQPTDSGDVRMIAEPLYRRVVNDESLTRGLGDIEARMLVEWLVDWAELLEDTMADPEEAHREINKLTRKAKAIRNFVVLWTDSESKAGAVQLAATERFQFPLPPEDYMPDEVMACILEWENNHLAQV
jgi:hypothetical protein